MHPLTPHVGSMSMIDIDASAIIQLVIVLLTFFVLRSLVFGPLLQSIGARAAKTEQARADAQAITAKARSLGEKYESEMLAARTRAANVKAELRLDGVRRKDEIQTSARADMAQKLNEVRGEVARQTESARREMQPQVDELSRAIAGKILGRSV
jgi:F-type H+-transporting ATPase subunit b